MKILNVAVHCGGGIGTTMKNFFDNDKDNQHTMACLNPDDPRSEEISIPVYYDLRNNIPLLNNLIIENDIVLLYWYNNPLYYEWLINNPLPPCRFIIWSQANCLFLPYAIPSKLVDMCDRFIIDSHVTTESTDYEILTKKQKNKFDMIWSSADMTKFQNVKRVPHDTFNIGYAGTIDFSSKLHPDFIEMCSKINIPNAKFIICSSGPDIDKLKNQVKEKGIEDKFLFTGRVDDLSVWFAQMDIFGYPLKPDHYGTCEQVLGEAMSAGVVPVVLNNPPERYIIDDDFNGVITTYDEYALTIEALYHDKSSMARLSENAKKSAFNTYSVDTMIKKWNIEFVFEMLVPKIERKWFWSGSEIFKESLGIHKNIFEGNDRMRIVDAYRKFSQFNSESKGSIRQYAHVFPEDKQLKEWLEILNNVYKK